MKLHKKWATFAALLVTSGCSSNLAPHPIVPTEHRGEVISSPIPTSSPSQYRQAYASFWWNCVAVKLEDENARCPFMCSGTPAAAAGCRDGAKASEKMVIGTFQNYGNLKARQRLESALMAPD